MGRTATQATRQRWFWAMTWAVLGCGLYVHAHYYRFFADDAYIALRYSQGLIERGELSYNPGERVEGFTSPLWVFLVAGLGLFGGSLAGWAQALGLACALGTFYATARLWNEIAPGESRWPAVAICVLLSISPPFAAWAMGGLETPLFALLLTLALAAVGTARRLPSVGTFATCGAWCALASLARPEGMALVFAVSALALVDGAVRKDGRLLLAFFVPVLALLGGYLLFRWSYYGYPLPNTFYVKTSGGRGLLRRGLRYVTAMAREFGWSSCFALAVVVFAPLMVLKRRWSVWRKLGSPIVLHLLTRGLIVLFVVYLVRVGGDFLDLYRFVVPILPCALVLVFAAGSVGWAWLRQRGLPRPWVWAAWGAAVLLVGDYGRHQLWMGTRSTRATWYDRPRGAPRKPEGVESLRYTREAAIAWAALGRALREVSTKRDLLATGAAGAAPFTAGLPNLDLYGLNDEWVAHHGEVVGSRPGHQRWAGAKYILQRKPTFLFVAGSFRSKHQTPNRDKFWSKHGYVSAEIKVDKKRYGALKTFYHPLLVHKSRVKALARHGNWSFETQRKKKRRSKPQP